MNDRPAGRLSFRAWLVQVALTTLSTPEYSQFLIRIAVREQHL